MVALFKSNASLYQKRRPLKNQHIFFSRCDNLFSNSFVIDILAGNAQRRDAVGQLRGSDIRAMPPVAPHDPANLADGKSVVPGVRLA